jgi:hypothetical protein
MLVLYLTINPIEINSAYADATYKEGIYTLADLNILSNQSYTVQNISKTNGIKMFVYNENYMIIQTLRLDPNSVKIDLLPLKENYNIVIAGEGEVTITLKSP